MNMPLLIKSLNDCAALLRSIGDDFWSAKMEGVAGRGPNLSSTEASQILGWFGGMGSLNDLIIMAANGHRVTPSEEEEMNARLNKLTSIIFDQATLVKKQG